MSTGFMEFVETEVWKKVYDEGWRMWKEGLDRIRKAENGLEAAMAKQLMLDAERILRVPTRAKSKNVDDQRAKERYGGELSKREEKVVREKFEKAVKGE